MPQPNYNRFSHEERINVLQKLDERWSPEQIARRLKLDGILPTVSHTAIYKYIYSQTDENERKKLLRQLRRRLGYLSPLEMFDLVR